MAFVLALCHDPFGFGSQRDRFRDGGLPEVVHPLGILGVTHHAKLVALVTNDYMTTVNGNHGDISARPIAFFYDLDCGKFLPLNCPLKGFALTNDLNACCLKTGAEILTLGEFGRSIAQLVQSCRFPFNVKILGNAYIFLGNPFGLTVTRAPLGEGRSIIIVGVKFAELGLAHHGGDKAALCV